MNVALFFAAFALNFAILSLTPCVHIAAGASGYEGRRSLAWKVSERHRLLKDSEGGGLPRRRALLQELLSPLDLPTDLRWKAPDLKTVVFIVDMCNKGGGAATTPEGVWKLFRGVPTNLTGYWETCSYNKTRFLLNSTAVVGPINMPCNGTGGLGGNWTVTSCHGMNPYNWFSWVEKYAVNHFNISLSDYNHRVMILPKEHQTFQEDDCDWAGISTTGPMNPRPENPNLYSYSYTWIAGDTWDNLWLWFHELGHALWLQHSNTPTREYGDLSSAMGASNGFGLRCYNAPQVWQLGWGSPFVMLTRQDLRPGRSTLRWIPAAHLDPDHSMRIALSPDAGAGRSGVPESCTTQLWVSYRTSTHVYDMPWKELGAGAAVIHEWDGYAFSAPDKPVILALLKIPNARTPSDVKDTSFTLPSCRLVITPKDMWDGYALISVCVKTMDKAVETDCSNGLDDDCDGLVDFRDPDCLGKGVRSPPPKPHRNRNSTGNRYGKAAAHASFTKVGGAAVATDAVVTTTQELTCEGALQGLFVTRKQGPPQSPLPAAAEQQ